jgi:hypothetical protein
MYEQSRQIDWKEMDAALVNNWYGVSKIMGTIIRGDMPYFTFKQLLGML